MALPNVPQSRNEKYLAKIAGQEVELPNEPLSREEQYLDYIAKNGGGGGGYVLPTATESRLGGVKIGSGISVEEDGTISADIPTKVSDLDNDVNFISDDNYVHTDNNYDDTAKGIVNGVTEALAGKQDTLTFDNIPTENSTNPVKSGGVYSADEAIRRWTTAEAKSVSGNPITLTDGSARKAEGLAVTCNPKQNLHGYDHPWAGGAGKNKLPSVLADIKSANRSGTWSGNAYTHNGVTYTVLTDDGDNVTGIKVTGTASANTNFVIAEKPVFDGQAVLSGCPSNGSDSTYFFQYSNNATADYKDVGSGISISQFDYTTYPTSNVKIQIRSGYACPTAGLMFYPMIRLASVSDATFEPYSNECPITGLTECVVDDHGFNIWDGTIILGKVIKCTDGTEMADYGYDCTDFIPVIPNTPYYFNVYSAISAQLRGMAWYDENKNYISGVPAPNNTKYGLITSPSNAKYVRCSLEKQYEDNACINISDPSKDGTYEPYQSTTSTITFGQTVYGGSVDFKTGKVTVTHAIADMGELTWSWDGGLGGFVSDGIASAVKKPSTNYQVFNGLCEAFPVVAREGASNNQLFVNTNGRIGVITNMYEANPTTFKTAMSGLHICYELATPIELTLTPAELELLKGYNYITSNGTTIALNYLPDSLLAEAENYVDEKIPPAPTTDGTYVLTCTVTSGTPAYSWESAT